MRNTAASSLSEGSKEIAAILAGSGLAEELR